MHTPGPTSRHVLHLANMIEAVCCTGCHHEPSDVAYCPITLALVKLLRVNMKLSWQHENIVRSDVT